MDMNVNKFRDFIGFQTFHTLQGLSVDRKVVRSTMSKYLNVTTLTPDYSKSNSSIQKHFADDYTQFAQQVPTIKNAIITLGLPDKYMLADEIEKVQEAACEEAMFASFNIEQCEGLHDYSTIHYEVEDDYVVNPHLVTFQEPVYVPPKSVPAWMRECEF
ncbi:hypothetical protein D3C85_1353850 [compost metagenome]